MVQEQRSYWCCTRSTSNVDKWYRNVCGTEVCAGCITCAVFDYVTWCIPNCFSSNKDESGVELPIKKAPTSEPGRIKL